MMGWMTDGRRHGQAEADMLPAGARFRSIVNAAVLMR